MRNCIRPDARSIPMVVPYASGVLSGQGMLVGAFFGVAASDAPQNATVECETRGEFELAKDPTQPMTAGARVFWDNTNRRLSTTPTGNFQVGIVTVAALAADTTVRAVLLRAPAAGA